MIRKKSLLDQSIDVLLIAINGVLGILGDVMCKYQSITSNNNKIRFNWLKGGCNEFKYKSEKKKRSDEKTKIVTLLQFISIPP